MTLVLDASAICPVLIADEGNDTLAGVIEALSVGDVSVPAHWPVEVANLLLVAFRKERLDEAALAQALHTLGSISVELDSCDPKQIGKRLISLARKYRLTAYDAAYLELAMRSGKPLATADQDLIRAARAENVELFGR